MAPSCSRDFRKGLVVGLSTLLMAGAFRAGAVEEDLDYGRVYAIQNRAHRMNQEFSIGMAFLPLDAFYKYFVGSFHYVLHFDDLWAWETHFGFAKYLEISTGLEAELGSRWDISPTDTAKIDYFFDTNLMLKPLYGKMALFDSAVIFSETYFLVGVGAQNFAGAWFPSGDIGVGIRIFLSDTLSMRFEAREYVYLKEGVPKSTLFLGVAFCYNGFAEERKTKLNTEEEPEVEP